MFDKNDDLQQEIDDINNRKTGEDFIQRAYKIQEESVDYNQINRARQIANDYNYENMQRANINGGGELKNYKNNGNYYNDLQDPLKRENFDEEYKKAIQLLKKDKFDSHIKDYSISIIFWCIFSIFIALKVRKDINTYLSLVVIGQAVIFLGVYLFVFTSKTKIVIIPAIILIVFGIYLCYQNFVLFQNS